MQSWNRVAVLAIRENRSTQVNMVMANSHLSLEALLGPGYAPAPGQDMLIKLHNLSNTSANSPFLTKLQLVHLAVALADLWVILTGRANELQVVLVEVIELLDHVISQSHDPEVL
jgi:hypothetical protein